MRRALHRSLALLLPLTVALALGACGDKAPSEGPFVGVAPPTSAGAPANLPPGVSEEVAARVKAAMDARRGPGGAPTLPAAFAPLKASDVELYLKVAPEMRAIAGDLGAVTKLAAEHGLSATQWVVLQGRVTGIAMGLKHGSVPETLKGDVEVVRPYQDRILAVIQGR